MNAFRMYKSLASVVAILFTLVISSTGQAADTQAPPPVYAYAPPAPDSCDRASDEARAAVREYNTTCGSSGLNVSNCASYAAACQNAYAQSDAAASSAGTNAAVSAVLSALGAGGQVAQDFGSKDCPKMTEAKGESAARDIKSDIKDTERQITDLKKELSDLQKTSAEKLADLNKQVAELDEEYKKAQADMSEQEIAAEAESRKALSEASQSIQDLTKNILTKEKQLAESISNKAAEMSKFTDFVIKNQCEVKIKEEVAKQVAANKKKGSSQSLAKINNLIKSNAKQGYSECVNTLVQSRNKVRLQFDNAIKTLEEDIAMARQSLSEAQSNLKELQANIEKAKQTAEQRKQDAYATYLQKRQNLAQEIQMLSQTTASESNRIERELMQLNMNLNTLKTDLNNLNATGYSGTKSVREVMGAYNAAAAAEAQAATTCTEVGKTYKPKLPALEAVEVDIGGAAE